VTGRSCVARFREGLLIAMQSEIAIRSTDSLVLPAASLEPRWYVVHTCSKHEKKVHEHLNLRNIEAFLPLYESLRRWKDRRVRLQLPLFPSYVFVRIALKDQLRVVEIPSVVRLVGFNGSPTALRDDEVDILRNGLAHQLRAVPHPYLTAGRRVRIRKGPLLGAEGILLRVKSNFRVVLTIDCLLRSASFEVDLADVVPLN
jgi:transcription antitermination factor NusG